MEFGEYVVNGGITLIDPIRTGVIVNDGAAKVSATFGSLTKAL